MVGSYLKISCCGTTCAHSSTNLGVSYDQNKRLTCDWMNWMVRADLPTPGLVSEIPNNKMQGGASEVHSRLRAEVA